jgi:hypothetical protein
MKGIWYNAIRETTAQDSLYHHTVQEVCDKEDESQWQIHAGILY